MTAILSPIVQQKTFPRYGLYLVGSTISGFGSDSSDVDMCLVSRYPSDMEPRVEAVLHLTHLQDHLVSTTGIFDTFNLIQAKVPILRFKDTLHLLEVDLNFNNCVGIRNTHLLYCYSQSELWLAGRQRSHHYIFTDKNMFTFLFVLILYFSMFNVFFCAFRVVQWTGACDRSCSS